MNRILRLLIVRRDACYYNTDKLSVMDLVAGFMKNRESGVNPERKRHCKHGGHIHGESRPLGIFLRRLVYEPMKCKSGDLLGL